MSESLRVSHSVSESLRVFLSGGGQVSRHANLGGRWVQDSPISQPISGSGKGLSASPFQWRIGLCCQSPNFLSEVHGFQHDLSVTNFLWI